MIYDLGFMIQAIESIVHDDAMTAKRSSHINCLFWGGTAVDTDPLCEEHTDN